MDEQTSMTAETQSDSAFDGDAFSASLTEESPAESLPDTGEETKPDMQRPPDAQEADAAGEEEAAPAAQGPAQPPATVQLQYGEQTLLLPQDAVNAIGQALGGDPIVLLQKGMNYDSKAERELRVLDQYAEASGLTRAQYLEQLEGMQRQQELASEVEKCRAEFPDTPDAALTAIAEGRCAAKRAAEQQRKTEREQYLAGVRQRAAQQLADNRRAAEAREWDAYEQLADVHKPEDIPPRVLELVQREGMTPTAAHWRYQAEQAQQQAAVQQKQQNNRAESMGSMQGASGDSADPFLQGFLNG